MKRNIYHILIWMGLISVLAGCLVQYFKPMTEAPSQIMVEKHPQMAFSDTLDYHEYRTVYISATNCDALSWSFSGSNTFVSIQCMAMNSGNYTLFSSSSPYTYYALSSNYYSDTGTWRPIYTDTWYVVFWNNDTDAQTTTLTYTMSKSTNFYCTYSTTTTTGDSYEPNDSFSTASSISSGTYSGLIASTDYDYYKIYVADDYEVSASISWSGSADLDLYLYDSSQSEMDSSISSYSTYESVMDSSSYGEYYYILVSKISGSATTYSLTVSTSYYGSSYSDPFSDLFSSLPFFYMFGGSFIFIFIGYFAINIALMVWLYRDANSRGMSGSLWCILTFFCGFCCCLCYLIVRHPKVQPPFTVYVNQGQPPTNQPPYYPPPNDQPPNYQQPQNYQQPSYRQQNYQQTSNQPSYQPPDTDSVHFAQPLQPTQLGEKKICSFCGLQILADALFCPHCGGRMNP